MRLIDRVAAALAAATDDLLIVANDPESDEWLPGARRIADTRSGLGPLGGILTALAATDGAILAVAWDMPFVPPTLLVDLRRRAGLRELAVVPESAPGRLEPLCAFYAGHARAAIEAWLESGESGAARFLSRAAGVNRIPVREVARFGDPGRIFFSVNDPAALRQAEQLA